jgi:regulator of PEP synthase PpsR (kinase-PPPase family)
VRGIAPPKELFEIDASKIVGLTIKADRLAEIRTVRVRSMGGGKRGYADLLQIYEELDEATAVHRRLGCPVIDVTDLSVEETAHRIIRAVEQRRRDRDGVAS